MKLTKLTGVDMSDFEKRLLSKDHFDIHRATAAKLFGVPEDQVTEGQRRVGKSYNYYLAFSN